MTASIAMSSPAASRPDRVGLDYWPVGRLVPSPRNARIHSDAQVAEIAGSIRAFGFTNPILADEDGDVIAGHGRLAAARLLGLSEVPVIPLKGLTAVQKRQLMLADNRIALNAGWDAEMLNLELRELSVLGADLEALGFTAKELSAALTPVGDGLTDENEIPEVAETATTRPGDIWCLGSHRLMCGDSTDDATVTALLRDVVPVLMVTDPPYGVEYDPEWRNNRGLSQSARIGRSFLARAHPQRRQPMKKILIVAAAAATVGVTPAFADYYIVQEKTTKECKIVETRPTETTWVQVGPVAFKTRNEADDQIKVVCKK